MLGLIKSLQIFRRHNNQAGVIAVNRAILVYGVAKSQLDDYERTRLDRLAGSGMKTIVHTGKIT